VHISFVRSISMDAFKAAEIERMRLGGNDNWRTFWEAHEDTKMRGLTWDDATIAERYSGEAGEEWKERLSAKVEGREYVPGQRAEAGSKRGETTSPTNAAPTRSAPRANTPLSGGSRTTSPGPAAGGPGKVKVDDRYFAKLGADNASRPAELPPSQGGKYAGFGNTPMPQGGGSGGGAALPGLDELQKDPVAALSKGFGWFTSTVTKTAKTVNNDFIQPTAKQVCFFPFTFLPSYLIIYLSGMYISLFATFTHIISYPQIADSDFAAQARQAAAQAAKSAQTGAKSAQEGFTRFVEGPTSGGYSAVPMDESKRAFWDDFSSLADQRKAQSSSIGTSAMGKGAPGSSGGGAPPKKKDEWDDW